MSDITSTVVYKTLDCVGFPKYKVGSDGSFWRWHKLKGWRRRGLQKPKPPQYIRVTLMDKGREYRENLHVLVLAAFVSGRPARGMQARHLNGDPLDNRLENLAWGTPKQNGEDKVRHGRSLKGEKNNLYGNIRFRGGKNPMAKFTEEDVRDIRSAAAAGQSTAEIARARGVTYQAIYAIVHRINWKHL
jgi:hypothetical protein